MLHDRAALTASGPRPLVLTADAELLDELLRDAAAAGVEVEVAAEPGAARSSWTTAPVVVVGADVAGRCRRAGLSRRGRVTLVGLDEGDADAGLWRQALDLGAETVLFLPRDEPRLVALLADAVEGPVEPGLLLAVIGGRGGAGATTLATGLAVTAAGLGHRTLLVDADPLGGGIDLALGGEHLGGLRWPDLTRAAGRIASAALAAALPTVDGLAVVSCDRLEPGPIPPDAMASVLAAAVRGNDLVVVDLPRSLDPAAVAALSAARSTLLVVPAEVRACAAAGRVAVSVLPHCADLRLVVRGPSPCGLRADLVSDTLGLPLAGELQSETVIPGALERGDGPTVRRRGALATLSARLLGDLLPADRARLAA